MKQIQNKRFEQNISCHFKKYERLNYDNENMEYSFGCALFLLSCFVSVFFSASVYASVLFDAIVNWIAYTSVYVPNIDYFGLRSLSDQTCAQALCFAQTTEKSDLF